MDVGKGLTCLAINPYGENFAIKTRNAKHLLRVMESLEPFHDFYKLEILERERRLSNEHRTTD